MHGPAEAIWEAVAPRLPGFTVEILPEVGSTNTELMQRARAGLTEPLLLVAERQTAGRGRLGRAWHSEAAVPAVSASAVPDVPAASGAGPDARADLPALTFSLGLPLAPQDWSGLSLAVGLAVAQALDPAAERIGLKWPNDLWVQGRKLGGILVETVGFAEPRARTSSGLAGAPAGRFTVVGIGINLALPAAEGLSTPPAALREWWPRAEAGQALGLVVPALVDALLAFEREGFAPLRAAYDARDLLRDRSLRLSDGTEGLGLGVDASGALQLATAIGVQRVTSAEVSVRPVGAP